MGIIDPELLVITYLTPQFTDARVATELLDDLSVLPFWIQVTRAGGGTKFTLGKPRIVIKSYATGDASQGSATRSAALQLAKGVGQSMLFGLRGQTVGGQLCSSVEEVSGPTFIADADPLIRGFAATYTLGVSAHN